jgi:hypothetical protein
VHDLMKNNLRKRLSTSIALCMHIKVKEWFDLDTFQYHTLRKVSVYCLRGVVVVNLGACL